MNAVWERGCRRMRELNGGTSQLRSVRYVPKMQIGRNLAEDL